MMRFVDAPVDGQSHRLRFGRRPQSRGNQAQLLHQVQLKLEPMNGRKRVEAALALEVADRPPVGAWGHTYREEWSPDALASITVARARRFGWDFVKFQPRASSFAEAFGSVYKPAGHRLKGPVLVSAGVPDLDSWSKVELTNPKALEDQVESIGTVARELGEGVPVIQTVFSPITVAGYLVGKSSARVRRELRQHPELVLPALDRIAAALVHFSRRSVAAGAAGIFYAISGYTSRDAMSESTYREVLLPYDVGVLRQLPTEAWFNVVHLCGSNLNFGLAQDMPAQAISWSKAGRSAGGRSWGGWGSARACSTVRRRRLRPRLGRRWRRPGDAACCSRLVAPSRPAREMRTWRR